MYSLQWPIQGGSARKGYLFQASGTLYKYKRVGISQVEVYKRGRKSVIYVFKMAFNQNISNRPTLWLYQFIY